MMASFIQRTIPIIFCLRAEKKTRPDKDGKPIDIGWQPLQDARFIYEWDVSFTFHPDAPGEPRYDLPHKVEGQHRALFPPGQFIGEAAGEALWHWANSDAAATRSPPLPRTDEMESAPADPAAHEGSSPVRCDSHAGHGDGVPFHRWSHRGQAYMQQPERSTPLNIVATSTATLLAMRPGCADPTHDRAGLRRGFESLLTLLRGLRVSEPREELAATSLRARLTAASQLRLNISARKPVRLATCWTARRPVSATARRRFPRAYG